MSLNILDRESSGAGPGGTLAFPFFSLIRQTQNSVMTGIAEWSEAGTFMYLGYHLAWPVYEEW